MATNNNTNGPIANNGLVAVGNTVSLIETVKGDLVASTGAGTAGVLTPGTPYQVMQADSTASTGLSYKNGLTQANNYNRIFGYGNAVSNYTYPAAAYPIGSTAILTANTIYFVPLNIYKSSTFATIGLEVTTAVAATSIRLGIYNCDNTWGFPGTLVLDAGTIDSSTIGNKTIAISQALYDKYWLCLISNGAPTVRTSYLIAPPYADVNAWWGINTDGSISNCSGCLISSVSSFFTALPASVISNTITKTTAFHLVYLRV